MAKTHQIFSFAVKSGTLANKKATVKNVVHFSLFIVNILFCCIFAPKY